MWWTDRPSAEVRTWPIRAIGTTSIRSADWTVITEFHDLLLAVSGPETFVLDLALGDVVRERAGPGQGVEGLRGRAQEQPPTCRAPLVFPEEVGVPDLVPPKAGRQLGQLVTLRADRIRNIGK